MKTERFEALVDAIIAIIITLIVMEIPLPKTTSFISLLELYPDFIAYTISFMLCFEVWHYHHNLFGLVNKLDSTITWASGLSLMVIGLLPHVTLMVANNFYSFTAQAMFGLLLFITDIILYIVDMQLIRKDKANIALRLFLNDTKQNTIFTSVLYIFGFIIGYFFYPPVILFCSFISLIWGYLPRKTRRKFKLPF